MANFNMTQRVKSNTRPAHHVSHAAANPWLERLERFGYLIRGLVYATIGVLALQRDSRNVGDELNCYDCYNGAPANH